MNKGLKKEDTQKNISAPVKQQSDEIESLKREIEEWKGKYLRALADYQNLERRVGEEKRALIMESHGELILKLLPFLDNLEKAEVFVKDDGLNLVKNQLWQTLSEAGIEEIDLIGKEFDPHVAEAVETIEGKQDNIVVDIVRKGYLYRNKLLRVAQVKVSRKKIEEDKKEKTKEHFKQGQV